MAIYHLSVKTIQRSKGRSSVAAAAYRAGECLHDNMTGLQHDFTRKGGVDFSEIIGFSGSREDLWNAAEQAEKRKDATTAREYEIAIPIELTHFQKQRLVQAYSKWLHKEYGCVVDACIHDIEGDNPHAHILTSTRAWNEEKKAFSTHKLSREWSDTKRKENNLPGRKMDLEKSRLAWGKLANQMLEKSGRPERIDHRSLKDQGVETLPSIKEGKYVTELRRRSEVDKEAREQLKQLDIYKKQEEIKSKNAQIVSLHSQLELIDDTVKKAVVAKKQSSVIEQRKADESKKIVAEELHQRIDKSKNQILANKQAYKAKIAFSVYRDWVLPYTTDIKYIDTRNASGTMLIWSSSALKDKGDSVSHFGKIEKQSIEASISIALAKGWTSLRIEGSMDYQKAILLEAAKHNLSVDYSTLNSDLISTYENAVAFNMSDSLMREERELPASKAQSKVSCLKSALRDEMSKRKREKSTQLAKDTEREMSSDNLEKRKM